MDSAFTKQGATLGIHEQALQFLLVQFKTLTDEQAKMRSTH